MDIGVYGFLRNSLWVPLFYSVEAGGLVMQAFICKLRSDNQGYSSIPKRTVHVYVDIE